MTKVKAISLVILAEIIIYIFILVGVPALNDAITPPIEERVSDPKVDTLLPYVDVAPEIKAVELSALATIVTSIIPGLIGIIVIMAICKQNKGVN